MSLTSPIYCVYDAFPLYHVSCVWIFCNFYQSTNQILSMMILKIMGLTPGPLVHALSLFDLNITLVLLMITLVLFVVWVLAFFSVVIDSIGGVIIFVVFIPIGVESKGGRSQSPDFTSNFENRFYSYSLVLTLSRPFRPLQIHKRYVPAHKNGIYPLDF